MCSGRAYTPCNADGTSGAPVACDAACAPGRGCVACAPGESVCVGNDVHRCGDDGAVGAVTQTCDAAGAVLCRNGACVSTCQVAESQPSNVGCEFWAVDLDQQDAFNDPASAPGGVLDVPTPPGWESGDTCCLDHLEDQMFPVESIGTRYVIPRSPVRSTSGYREPDVLRFVGAAEPATVTTTLPAPFDSFTLQPGEVRTTWTRDNVVVTADRPVIVGQVLVSNQYVDGPFIGDPSLTVFPPVDQFRSDYIILTPGSWTQSWGVLVAEPGAAVTVDGRAPAGCITEPAGNIAGVTYESRRCPLAEGVHRLAGDRAFGVVVYGYGGAGSYAFVGGADVRRIYDPPG